jgi:cell division protease FtsH
VSSSATARRLEGGTPGGGRSNAAPAGTGGDRGSMPGMARLADRIEENLSRLLVRAEEILRENERHVLSVAHALETHKTLSGEDITAIFDGTRGPLVDGTPYADDEFIARLREYHVAAELAHREHNKPSLPMPVAAPAYAISYDAGTTYGITGNGNGSFLDGGFGANGNGNGSGGNGSGGDDIIELGGGQA